MFKEEITEERKIEMEQREEVDDENELMKDEWLITERRGWRERVNERWIIKRRNYWMIMNTGKGMKGTSWWKMNNYE